MECRANYFYIDSSYIAIHIIVQEKGHSMAATDCIWSLSIYITFVDGDIKFSQSIVLVTSPHMQGRPYSLERNTFLYNVKGNVPSGIIPKVIPLEDVLNIMLCHHIHDKEYTTTIVAKSHIIAVSTTLDPGCLLNTGPPNRQYIPANRRPPTHK